MSRHAVTARSDTKIYVYDLPKDFTECERSDCDVHGLYGLEKLLPDLIRNSSYITSGWLTWVPKLAGEEADLLAHSGAARLWGAWVECRGMIQAAAWRATKGRARPGCPDRAAPDAATSAPDAAVPAAAAACS